MKKWKKMWALLLALIMLLCGCGSSTAEEEEETTDDTKDNETVQEETVEYPYDYASSDFFSIANCWNYAPVATISGVLEDGNGYKLDAVDGFMTMQGGCTDGTYAYLLLEKKNTSISSSGEGISQCMLFKLDMTTWEVVGQSKPLAVDHGNGLAYNPNTNQLIVAHCKNLTSTVSFIDPNTLAVTGSKDVGRNIYAITYSPTYNLYVAGIKGTDNYMILDENFNQIDKDYEGVANGLSYQSLYCDDDYIYITYTGDYQAIMCYDWDGYFCGVLRVDSFVENEAMFQAGDDYYMTFYTGNGGTVYHLEFDKDLLY